MPDEPSFKKTEQAHRRYIARMEDRLKQAREFSERLVRRRAILTGAAIAGGILFYQLNLPVLFYAVIVLFPAAFGVLIYIHSRLKKGILRMERWRAIKKAHLARLLLDWNGLSPAKDYTVPDYHPYAYDLDLVGPHSLMRLIDTTVSTRGRQNLTAFLLSPDPTSLERRQQLIRELVPRSLLRDRIVLEANSVSPGELDSDGMIRDLRESESPAGAGGMLILLGGLAAATLALLIFQYGLGGPRYWPYTFLTYGVIYFLYSGRLAQVFGRALTLRSQVERLENLLKLLERRKAAGAPELETACAPFRQTHSRPSHLIRRVVRICDALSVKANPIANLVLNAVGPWNLYFACRYRKVRESILGVFPSWLDALGRIEAAAALAQFAALHPDYHFPPIKKEAAGRPFIEATGMGHPLIPAAVRVMNDFRQDGLGTVTLLTGSNMSGKSTFLRTTGINLCLAQAGGPVCAKSFSASPFRIFCSLRVQDNLERGWSHFYAEVRRLKMILDASSDRNNLPVLFLIDEIFSGTNSRERITGSRSYLYALVRGNGLGLVTTHDLELAGLSGESPSIINRHFQEVVLDGRLTFDYRLRPGPCLTTNALRIMAMEGLPVPDPSEGR